MLSILAITFPVFAIVGLGYLLTSLKVFKPSDMKVLSTFVMTIALPLLVFRATATRSFAELIDPSFLVLMGLTALSTQAVVWVLMTLRGTGPARRALAVMGSATPNSAFMAFPINSMIFPELAPSILAMCLLTENFLTLPVGLTLLEASRPSEGRSALRQVRDVITSMLKRPLIIAVLLGSSISLSGLRIPGPLDRISELLSQAASPVALFVIGGSLVGLSLKGNLKLAGAIAAFKLVLHPTMAFVLLSLCALLQLPLPQGDYWKALIISAAMPIMTIFPLLAGEVGHGGMGALTVVIATSAAFFTLTLLLTVLI